MNLAKDQYYGVNITEENINAFEHGEKDQASLATLKPEQRHLLIHQIQYHHDPLDLGLKRAQKRNALKLHRQKILGIRACKIYSPQMLVLKAERQKQQRLMSQNVVYAIPNNPKSKRSESFIKKKENQKIRRSYKTMLIKVYRRRLQSIFGGVIYRSQWRVGIKDIQQALELSSSQCQQSHLMNILMARQESALRKYQLYLFMRSLRQRPIICWPVRRSCARKHRNINLSKKQMNQRQYQTKQLNRIHDQNKKQKVKDMKKEKNRQNRKKHYFQNHKKGVSFYQMKKDTELALTGWPGAYW